MTSRYGIVAGLGKISIILHVARPGLQPYTDVFSKQNMLRHKKPMVLTRVAHGVMRYTLVVIMFTPSPGCLLVEY